MQEVISNAGLTSFTEPELNLSPLQINTAKVDESLMQEIVNIRNGLDGSSFPLSGFIRVKPAPTLEDCKTLKSFGLNFDTPRYHTSIIEFPSEAAVAMLSQMESVQRLMLGTQVR